MFSRFSQLILDKKISNVGKKYKCSVLNMIKLFSTSYNRVDFDNMKESKY